MATMAPVTNGARSESKNAISSATSSGLPTLPIGVFTIQTLDGKPRSLSEFLHHRCRNIPRGNGIDSNPLSRVFQGSDFRQNQPDHAWKLRRPRRKLSPMVPASEVILTIDPAVPSRWNALMSWDERFLFISQSDCRGIY